MDSNIAKILGIWIIAFCLILILFIEIEGVSNTSFFNRKPNTLGPVVDKEHIEFRRLKDMLTLPLSAARFLDTVQVLHFNDQKAIATLQYRLINTGDTPLQIALVDAMCQCVEVQYPQGMILSGDTAVLTAKVDVNGVPEQEIMMHVYANTSKLVHPLRISISR